MPYEWFASAVDARRRIDRPVGRHILVLWLDAGVFARIPLSQSTRLIQELAADKAHVGWRILGPTDSDGLKAMVDEAAAPKVQQTNAPTSTKAATGPVRFYSATATAPDSVLLQHTAIPEAPIDLATFFDQKGVNLIRTVADDEKVANALVDELKLRGLKANKLNAAAGARPSDTRHGVCDEGYAGIGDAPSRIAIVAEWDTMFGRSVRRNYRAEVDQPGFCVERFSYLRGLDGLMPQRPKPSPDSQDTTPATNTADKTDLRTKDGPVERAEGQGQFDYLRRLAAQMRARDSELRRAYGSPGIQAIGVLGNDVHDKLLVLKALQPEFPNAVFFTTELDQRLLHPREQPVARNLIVGASFGLQLYEGLQAGVPPFRDSSQTAVFLATRLALDDGRRALLPGQSAKPPAAPASSIAATDVRQDAVDPWLVKPRVFEIGRTRAFDFSEPDAGNEHRKNKSAVCRGVDWAKCPDIHPAGSPMVWPRGVAALSVIFSLAVLALWLPALLIGRYRRQQLRESATPAPLAPDSLPRQALQHTWLTWMVLVVLLVSLQVVLPVWLALRWPDIAAWLTHNGKPLVAFEGISLWPTEGIRLFTTVLCVYLIWEAWSALERNTDDIAKRFALETSRQVLIAERRKTDWALKWTEKLSRMFSWQMFKSSPTSGAPLDPAMSPATIDFWQRYLVQNRLAARLARTLALVLLAWAVGALVTLPLNEVPLTPHRGERSLLIHRWLSVSAHLAMSVLVLFVVDATAFCVQFVRGLRLQHANWPDNALKIFETKLDLPRGEHLDNWIDLQFVALRTQVVGRLVYYPFLVLSLLLLSRSPMFDDWNMPMGAVFVAFNCGGAALGCAVALRIMAERSRRHAIAAVKDDLLRLNGGTLDWTRRSAPPNARPSMPTAKQLELLLGRVEGLRDGAFAPFSQQPLLKALLLPFATFGGTTLLDYMALANL